MPKPVTLAKSQRLAALGILGRTSSSGRKKSPARADWYMSLRFQFAISQKGFVGPPAVNFGNHGNPESHEILQLYSFSKSGSKYLRTDSSQNPPHSAMRSVAPPASNGLPSQRTSFDQAWLILKRVAAAAAAAAPLSAVRRLTFVSDFLFMIMTPTPETSTFS